MNCRFQKVGFSLLLAILYSLFAVSAPAADTVPRATITVGTPTNGETFSITNGSAGGGTFGRTYIWTNFVSASKQFQTTNNSVNSATNFFNRLALDYTNQLTVTWSNASIVRLQGPVNGTLIVRASGSWAVLNQSNDPLTTNGNLNVHILYADQIIGPATNTLGGGTANAIEKASGNGTNTSIWRALTVKNTTNLFHLASVTVTGGSNACINGTYTWDATRDLLTNQCQSVFLPFSPGTNGYAYVDTVTNYTITNSYIVVSNAEVSGANGIYRWSGVDAEGGARTWAQGSFHASYTTFSGKAKWVIIDGALTAAYCTTNAPYWPPSDRAFGVTNGFGSSPFTSAGKVWFFNIVPPDGYVPTPFDRLSDPTNGFQWMIFSPIDGTTNASGIYTNFYGAATDTNANWNAWMTNVTDLRHIALCANGNTVCDVKNAIIHFDKTGTPHFSCPECTVPVEP